MDQIGESFREEVKVPQDRIAVIIGKDGETKKSLETELECNLDINSEEGDVLITTKDSINLLVIKDVIKAIARGFNPEVAKKLINDDFYFELINLVDYNPKKNHQERLKGRVIGRDGKARSIIEEYTGCYISVYGKTVAIIGSGDNVRIAHKAIDSLLQGSPHAYVYKWLEKERSKQTFSPEF